MQTYIVAIETSDTAFSHDPWEVEDISVQAQHAEAAQELAVAEVEARPGRWAHRHVRSVSLSR